MSIGSLLFFRSGVVHNPVQIVPEHLHQMDGWCYCKRNCRPATGLSNRLHLSSPKTRSAGNGVANKEES